MSLPPLPDVFGNYALKGFTEISPPEAISWLPQTAGWRVLGALLLTLLLWRGWRWLQHWHRNRYRREALRELDILEQSTEGLQLVSEINALLKRAALAAYPRTRVAPLHGEAWLAFLRTECESVPFSDDLESLLATGSYRPQSVKADAQQALIQASRRWIGEHRGSTT